MTKVLLDFIWILAFSVHVCLLFDASRWQKHPTCKLNYLLASIVSALFGLVALLSMTQLNTFAQWTIALFVTTIMGLLITANIQRVLKYQIDF